MISISGSLYLDNFSETFVEVFFIRGYNHIDESAFLIPIVLDDNVRAACRHFSICMIKHVMKNGDIILFFHRFWLVFVPLVYCARFVFFKDLPVYIGCHIVVPVLCILFCIFFAISLCSSRQHGL